jgi:hypothetical protein
MILADRCKKEFFEGFKESIAALSNTDLARILRKTFEAHSRIGRLDVKTAH